MPTQVQFRRGSTAQNNAFTGAVGEITVDTDLDVLRVHDGSSAGGFATVGATTIQTITNKSYDNPRIINNIVFEGSTDDAYETILNVVDPTADRVIVLPNADGTVVLRSTTDTLTNKTFDTAGAGNILQINGTQVSDKTGTGKVVLDTSPAIATSITTASTSFDLINTTATTVNFAKAATTLSIGATTGTTTVNNNLTITGNLTVSGTTTTVDSTTVNIQNAFVFEGATADAYETTLTTVDPTEDRSISLPNASGTIVLKDTTDTLTNKTYDTAGTGNVFKVNGTQISDITGTGKAVLDTSPTLATPTIGVATATSINKMVITAPATGSTLAVADGKTLTASNTLTFTGTDSSSVAFGAGGTVLYSGGALGTPSSATLTNATGLPVATGISGLGTGVATFLATPSSANLVAAMSDEVGSGALYFTGGALGTPASATLTNATGLPIDSGVSGLGTGIATFLATPTSANLASAVTGETGTGALVFANTPTLVTPVLGAATATTLEVGTGVGYGTVSTTQYASVWGQGAGANPYSVMQVRSSDGVSGLGMQAYTGSGTLYGNTNIIFALGTIRDKDIPASLVTKAYIDSTGLTVTGVASATSFNKVAITAPATGSTLTIADGKTLTSSNSVTFTSTDATSTPTVAFGTGGTVAYTANKLSVFAATSSSELAGVISDETGSGALVFGTAPTFTTSIDGGATFTAFATPTTLNIGTAATTISIGSTAHTGTTTINNDLSVYGTITFGNGASSLSSTTIQIDDTLISLADNNTADILDIGFYAGYRQSSTDYHTGLVRDASDSGTWKLFSGVSAQPTGTVDFTSAVYNNLQLATVKYSGSSSGTTTVQAAASASGTLTLPAATDTLVGKATTDTLTNKTYDTAGTGNSFKINGTAISDITGTGKAVLDASPTLTTPTIGVATATSINKVAITAPATSATLTIADGKTLTASNTLTFTGTDASSVAFGTGGTVAYTNVATLSSLTSVGTIGTGTWNGSVIAGQYGGTGVANTGKTITLGGNLTTSGAYATTLTATNTTSVTLPTSGTLSTLDGSETLTNKSLTSPVVTGTQNNNSIVYETTFSQGSITTATAVHTFDKTVYRSASYLFQITNGSFYKVIKVLVVHDGTTATQSDAYIDDVEISTGTQNTTYAFDISGGNVRLLVTAASGTATVKGMVSMIVV